MLRWSKYNNEELNNQHIGSGSGLVARGNVNIKLQWVLHGSIDIVQIILLLGGGIDHPFQRVCASTLDCWYCCKKRLGEAEDLIHTKNVPCMGWLG